MAKATIACARIRRPASAAWLRLRRSYQRHVVGLQAETIASGVTVNLLLAVCVTALCAVELAAILAW